MLLCHLDIFLLCLKNDVEDNETLASHADALRLVTRMSAWEAIEASDYYKFYKPRVINNNDEN